MGTKPTASQKAAGMTDEELERLVAKHGTKRAAAAALGVNEATFKALLIRRGLCVARPPKNPGPMPKLTIETLHAALQPPNNCTVFRFREALDATSREVFDEALSYESRDFPASKIRTWLIGMGFKESLVPGTTAIQSHRTGTRPCRCKG